MRAAHALICSISFFGCVEAAPTPQSDQPEPEAGSSSGPSNVGENTTEVPDDDAPERDTDADNAGIGFIEMPDGGPPNLPECDPYAQDCGESGHKCVHVNRGEWTTVCVPISPHPAEHGGACQRLGEVDEGLDDCPAGDQCWDVDPETNMGRCVSLCTGSPESPLCAHPDERCNVGKSLAVCFEECSPLVMDCPTGCGCYPSDDAFSCFPDQSGDAGAFGDPCEFVNVCDPGHACLNPEVMSVCEPGAAGCCGRFCDLTGEDPCPALDPATQCIPWYEDGQAPPDFETIGLCAIPE